MDTLMMEDNYNARYHLVSNANKREKHTPKANK